MPYIGNQPGTGVRSRFIYTATASQTTFSGADDNSKTLKYADSAYVDVFLNGVCLVPGTDYTASTKTSVVLTQAASLSDTLEVVAYDIATISDTVSKADGGTFEGDLGITNSSPDLTLTNNTTEDTDGGRESTVTFKGLQSGGEESTLAEIRASHDATADDQKGDLIFKTNDGSDGASPTEAMRIDANQNVGIGTSPSTDWRTSFDLTAAQVGLSGCLFNLDVSTGDRRCMVTSNAILNSSGDFQHILEGHATIYSQQSGTHRWYTAASASAGATASATERMRIDSSGKVGIGTTTPTGNANGNAHVLEVHSSSGSNPPEILAGGQAAEISIAGGSGASYLWSTGAYPLVMATNGTERMRIESSGHVLINKTSTTQTSDAGHAFIDDGRYFSIAGFSNSSQETLSVYSTGVSSYRFYVDYGGTIHATSTSISAISDQRLKENITDLDTGLDEVLALRPRRFDWINGDGENVAGFIAQEVETVLPDLIDNFKHTELSDAKGLKMGDMIPTLVKAIQELSAKIETLETQNTTQATQIADLITRVTALEAE